MVGTREADSCAFNHLENATDNPNKYDQDINKPKEQIPLGCWL